MFDITEGSVISCRVYIPSVSCASFIQPIKLTEVLELMLSVSVSRPGGGVCVMGITDRVRAGVHGFGNLGSIEI